MDVKYLLMVYTLVNLKEVKLMLYILNSLPNTIWTETTVQVRTLKVHEVQQLLQEELFTSAVGHADFAEVISTQVGVTIPFNRLNVSPNWETDKLLACLVTPPRRLNEGEKWTEDEIKSMPIKFVLVQA